MFAPWRRVDETNGFRWDPAEDRRYALRFQNPSGDAGRTVHGANCLAAIGLPVLPGAAVMRRGRIHFLVLGTRFDANGEAEITWLVWTPPASLAGVCALLAHPALVAEAPTQDPSLLCLGVSGCWRVRRFSVGKYFNFTRAQAL